jgi:putative tributyrin esterase
VRNQFSAVLILILLCAAPAGGQQPAKPRHTPQQQPARLVVQDHTLHSKSLQREVRYRIILPAGYRKTSRRFPVLYLLHGLYGDYKNWDTLTSVARYAESYPWIIVMPDAGDSWYVNSATQPAERLEDFVIQDLIPHVDETWRSNRSAHQRMIAGLSMGGYGAMKFALKYPQMFAAAGSLSGAFNAPLDLDEQRADFRKNLQQVFGPAGSATRTGNDIFRLAREARAAVTPFLYIDCGTSDYFFATNHQFAAVLQQGKFAFEFHAVPGDHGWRYWDQRVAVMMETLARRSRLQ